MRICDASGSVTRGVVWDFQHRGGEEKQGGGFYVCTDILLEFGFVFYLVVSHLGAAGQQKVG